MSEEIRDLLKKNHMSVTDSRLQILELFYHAPGALAHADIEKKASDKIDRVTIYRTLQTFEEKGIIHTIPSADNSVKYALCKHECAEGHHHDNHVEFKREKELKEKTQKFSPFFINTDDRNVKRQLKVHFSFLSFNS